MQEGGGPDCQSVLVPGISRMQRRSQAQPGFATRDGQCQWVEPRRAATSLLWSWLGNQPQVARVALILASQGSFRHVSRASRRKPLVPADAAPGL